MIVGELLHVRPDGQPELCEGSWYREAIARELLHVRPDGPAGALRRPIPIESAVSGSSNPPQRILVRWPNRQRHIIQNDVSGGPNPPRTTKAR